MTEVSMQKTLICLVSICAAVGTTRGENWPEFRGPHGDGHAEASGLPVRWSEQENVRWKTPIHGKGWSSPVVWGDQIWLTTAPKDGTQRFAVCVDRRTGKILHDIKVFDDPKPAFCIDFNSYASPTPAIEEGRVYVHFGSCGTACLDTATGKILWERRDLPCDHWRGPGSSPALYKDLLFIHFDGYDRQYIVALNKKTGKTAWRKDRDIDYGTDNGDQKKAYGTPSVITVAGKPQLVSSAAVATLAYDPLTGAELWKVYHGGMNAASRPVFAKGNVLVCSADGGLGLVAVRPDGKGDLTRTNISWQQKKGAPNRSSLLQLGGLLYMVNDPGLMSCVEAQTGRLIWQEHLRGRQFIASPVSDGKHIYVFNRDGGGFVVEAGRTFKLLATNKLDEGCMASPAIAGKTLIVRTLEHLYCIADKGGNRN
jgi:outer membrane protein assembly factor BamB